MNKVSDAELASLQLVQDLELEMMADMYNRMTTACHRKCVGPQYRDPDLAKGEAVCVDRCVAKYMDVHERVGKKLTELSMKDADFMKRMQAEPPKP